MKGRCGLKDICWMNDFSTNWMLYQSFCSLFLCRNVMFWVRHGYRRILWGESLSSGSVDFKPGGSGRDVLLSVALEHR